MITKTTRIALIAAFATMTASTAAQAADERAAEINMAGYDLGNPTQVAKLKDNIRVAARTVCGLRDDDGFAHIVDKRNCYRKAIAAANAKVDAQVALRSTNSSSAIVYQNNTTVLSPKR